MALATPQWLQSSTLTPALIFGIVTVGFPFFIMHPAFGLGLAASKASDPMQARLRSLMNHVVFGVGLYLSALALSSLAPLRSLPGYRGSLGYRVVGGVFAVRPCALLS